jgi:3-methyladenine DNA glycosylase AlkC
MFGEAQTHKKYIKKSVANENNTVTKTELEI